MDKVILYSNGCPRCNVLKKKLESANVSFEVESDIEVIMSKGFMSVPILEVNGVFLTFENAVQYVNEKQ